MRVEATHALQILRSNLTAEQQACLEFKGEKEVLSQEVHERKESLANMVVAQNESLQNDNSSIQ